MENITIGQIVTIGAFIMTAGGVIGYLLKPVKAYQEKTKQIDKEIEKIKEHQDNDNERLKTLERDSKMNLRVLNEILSHLQTNNNTNGMAKVKKDLEEYIIER